MANTVELLYEIQERACKDAELRTKLLESQKKKNPLSAFCKTCQAYGYEIYDMDVIHAGEEFYATMRRSTNGGGENAPMLDGEDDFYELFMAVLESHQQ